MVLCMVATERETSSRLKHVCVCSVLPPQTILVGQVKTRMRFGVAGREFAGGLSRRCGTSGPGRDSPSVVIRQHAAGVLRSDAEEGERARNKDKESAGVGMRRTHLLTLTGAESFHSQLSLPSVVCMHRRRQQQLACVFFFFEMRSSMHAWMDSLDSWSSLWAWGVHSLRLIVLVSAASGCGWN
jgi:hypothetical protein